MLCTGWRLGCRGLLDRPDRRPDVENVAESCLLFWITVPGDFGDFVQKYRFLGSSCFSANLTGFDGSEKVKGPEIYLDLVMTSLEPAQFAGSMTLHRSLKVPLTMVVTVALVTRVFVSCRMIEHTG